MVGQSKYHLQLFSMKPSNDNSSPSSSTLTLILKIKTLIQTLILRTLSKAKSLVDKNQHYYFNIYSIIRRKKKTATANFLLGSFRLHYNWCSSSSHVIPIPNNLDYYDIPTWNKNSVIPTTEQNIQCGPELLSGYLQWLEGENGNFDMEKFEEEDKNEIDRLADMFIENCHEKGWRKLSLIGNSTKCWLEGSDSQNQIFNFYKNVSLNLK